MRRFLLILLTLLALSLAPANAQLDNAPVLSADQIVQRIQPLHPKTLVLVFDVTQSTRHNGVFSLERAASATLIEDGCRVGDRIVLLKFGTGYKTVFDKTLAESADKQALVDADPAPRRAGPGDQHPLAAPRGTAADRERPAPARASSCCSPTRSTTVPAPADPNYPDYLAYYTLKGLTDYPDTPENRDYERLLRTLAATGRVQQYGIGVGIAPDGRPIERLPRAGQGDDAAAGPMDITPVSEKPIGTEQVHHSPWPLVAGGARPWACWGRS